MRTSVAGMLVVTRFDAVTDPDFLERARTALAAFAARPGYLRGRVGRAADDPAAWVLTTEWSGVGAYRRSLGAYDVKMSAAPLLSLGRDEVSAFEILLADEGDSSSDRAPGADAANVGEDRR